MRFLELLGAAERHHRHATRFVRRHAALDVPLRLVRNVKRDLVVELAVELVASEKCPERVTQSVEHMLLAEGLGTAEHPLDGGNVLPPGRRLIAEHTATARREPVELGTSVVVTRAPLGGDATLLLQSLQGQVERTLIDAEDAARALLDALRDTPAVHRLERERPEDQEVEGAANNVWLLGCCRPAHRHLLLDSKRRTVCGRASRKSTRASPVLGR